MQKIISVVSQINGVGKTTTAVNLSASLAIFEKKTLLVDCDPAGGATELLASSEAFDRPVACDSLGLAFKTDLEYLDFIPEHSRLKDSGRSAHGDKGSGILFGKGFQDFTSQYDYVIMDTPSTMGFITITALEASNWVVVPALCSDETVPDIEKLLNIVQAINRKRDKDLRIAGVLFTRCRSQEAAVSHYSGEAGEHVEEIAFHTVIPQDPLFRMGDMSPGVISLVDIGSPGASAYLDFAYELVNKIEP